MKQLVLVICGVLILVSCTILTDDLPGETIQTQLVNTPSTELELLDQSAGLLRVAVPSEAEELKNTLETVSYPQRDLIEITTRLSDPGQTIPKVARDVAWGFEIGDKHEFWIEDKNTQEKSLETASLIYKTSHAYFFVEEGIDLDESQLMSLADRFEKQIYPEIRNFFGEEWSPGIDNDPRLIILIADIGVNYQNSMDEYSKLVTSFSNEMEIIYIGADSVASGDDCMFAHEFQHLIQWHVDSNEETWMVEGFSEIACRIIDRTAWYSDRISAAFAQHPDTQLNAWRGELDQAARQYGASSQFMSYFLDRFGEAATRALVADQDNGINSVDKVLNTLAIGIGFDELFADWAVANYLNDSSFAEGRYGYIDIIPQKSQPDLRPQAQQLPVERRTDVKQFAADYILLEEEGRYQIDFTGATLVGLAPISPYSGNYIWWGGRGTNSDTTLTREFDLTGLERATLNFYTWYDIEEGYDYAYVEISPDGEYWTTLPGQRTTNNNPNGVNIGNGYTGASGGWVQEAIDLTPYIGQKVYIRFEYVTDDGPTCEGIFLDDIQIIELNYLSDVEVDEGGWHANGFIRNSILLPQEWQLQMITQKQNRTIVERLHLNPDNTGRWKVDLDENERVVLLVSGLTRSTTEPADYWYRITSNSFP